MNDQPTIEAQAGALRDHLAHAAGVYGHDQVYATARRELADWQRLADRLAGATVVKAPEPAGKVTLATIVDTAGDEVQAPVMRDAIAAAEWLAAQRAHLARKIR